MPMRVARLQGHLRDALNPGDAVADEGMAEGVVF